MRTAVIIVVLAIAPPVAIFAYIIYATFGWRGFVVGGIGLAIGLLPVLLEAGFHFLWNLLFGPRKSGQHPPDAAPCPTCGYDLRASRDRCPECGTVRKVPWPRTDSFPAPGNPGEG